ncbi:MAG: helix-turn-helix domain-containing protein [Solirubrobacteraceae bacterium]
MTLLIDTGVVPARQRVDFWSSASCYIYHPLAIRADARDRFSARMWGDQVGSIGLYRIAAAPNTMTRTPKAIAAGDPECLHLSLLLRGHMKISQQSRADLIAPGDLTAYDTSQPAVMRADEPFEALVLQMPRAMLGEYASRIAGLTALRIPGDGGLPRLAAQFFRGVVAGVAAGNIDRRDTNVAERIIDLARGLYADHLDAAQGGRPRSRTELLLRAKAFIDASLGDPALGPEQVARACFISKRYLHRLFEDEGLTVCDFIRAARLDRCRRDLLDPAFAEDTILAIASRWGLPSAPHFSRLFRAAYGCSPRHLRCGVPG